MLLVNIVVGVLVSFVWEAVLRWMVFLWSIIIIDMGTGSLNRVEALILCRWQIHFQNLFKPKPTVVAA